MMRTPRAIVLAGLVVVVAAITGCAEEAPTPVAPEPIATASPATTPATTPAPSLADGSHFVLVRGIEGAALIIDPAEFLSGEEARNAAITDGFLAPGEDLPNDFYLRNTEEEHVSLTVAEAATFTLIGFDATGGLVPREVDAAAFLALLAGADASEYYGFVAPELPLHIEVSEGVVQGGSQQYVP